MADIFFALFAAVFLASRNFIFPIYIIGSIPKYAYIEGNVPIERGYIRDCAFLALCVLEVLHIYWGGLILQMVKLAVTNSGVQGDIRNDDD